MSTAITVRGGHKIVVQDSTKEVAQKFQSPDDFLYFKRTPKDRTKEEQLVLRHCDIQSWSKC